MQKQHQLNLNEVVSLERVCLKLLGGGIDRCVLQRVSLCAMIELVKDQPLSTGQHVTIDKLINIIGHTALKEIVCDNRTTRSIHSICTYILCAHDIDTDTDPEESEEEAFNKMAESINADVQAQGTYEITTHLEVLTNQIKQWRMDGGLMSPFEPTRESVRWLLSRLNIDEVPVSLKRIFENLSRASVEGDSRKMQLSQKCVEPITTFVGMVGAVVDLEKADKEPVDFHETGGPLQHYVKLALAGQRSGHYTFSRKELEALDQVYDGALKDAKTIREYGLEVETLTSEVSRFKTKFSGASSACNEYRQEVASLKQTVGYQAKNFEELRRSGDKILVALTEKTAEVDQYDSMYNDLLQKNEQLQNTIDQLRNQNNRLISDTEQPLGDYHFERKVGGDVTVCESFSNLPTAVLERISDKNNGRHVEVAEITGFDKAQPGTEASPSAVVCDTSLLSDEEEAIFYDMLRHLVKSPQNCKIVPAGYDEDDCENECPSDDPDCGCRMTPDLGDAVEPENGGVPIELDDQIWLG